MYLMTHVLSAKFINLTIHVFNTDNWKTRGENDNLIPYHVWQLTFTEFPPSLFIKYIDLINFHTVVQFEAGSYLFKHDTSILLNSAKGSLSNTRTIHALENEFNNYTAVKEEGLSTYEWFDFHFTFIHLLG